MGRGRKQQTHLSSVQAPKPVHSRRQIQLEVAVFWFKMASASPVTDSHSDNEKDIARDVVMASDMSESKKAQALAGLHGPPPFKLSSLWQAPVLNPLNLKSYTLPIFNLRNPYSRNFHLSWRKFAHIWSFCCCKVPNSDFYRDIDLEPVGFFVAFLSWFAFPPLIPEAIKTDLGLTAAQIGNANIVGLCATLIVRVVTGPLVDRYGPRKVMASILIIGAIPSGLAGTVSSAQGLYVIRFFIGILGGTFVPCQAWTTAFFDKSIVGRAK